MPIFQMTDEEWDCLSGCACECGYEYLLEDIIQLKTHKYDDNDDDKKSHEDHKIKVNKSVKKKKINVD